MQILPLRPPDGKTTLQVVVIGNSRTAVTLFGCDAAKDVAAAPTADILAGETAALELGARVPTVIVSVVPAANAVLSAAVPEAVFLRHDDAPIEILCSPRTGLGTDRLANALAARDICGAPVLAVDCGTATTLTLVDAAGRLAGGAITLGLGSSRDALAARTAQLFEATLQVPTAAIGTDTLSSMQVGLVLGPAGMIAHLAERMAPGVPIVMTGGWSRLLADLVPGALRHGNLTAWGGRVYWESLKARS